jgi:hypothetical protein
MSDYTKLIVMISGVCTLLLGNSCSRPESSPYARKKSERSLASVKSNAKCQQHVDMVAKKGHIYHDVEKIKRIPEALINGKDKMILNSMVWSNHKKPVYVYLVKTRKNGDPYLYAYLVEEKKKGPCHITNILPVTLEEEVDLDEIKLKD